MWNPFSLSWSCNQCISWSFGSSTLRRRPSLFHFWEISKPNSFNSSFVGVPCLTTNWNYINDYNIEHTGKLLYQTKEKWVNIFNVIIISTCFYWITTSFECLLACLLINLLLCLLNVGWECLIKFLSHFQTNGIQHFHDMILKCTCSFVIPF